MNKREDKYGGDLTDRAYFAAQVIRECRKAVGDDMPIILRFSEATFFTISSAFRSFSESDIGVYFLSVKLIREH